MKMTYKNKGFTLVELIVSITIMSILAVVAFVSVKPYLWNARNAVRLDSAVKLTSEISTFLTKDLDIMVLTGTWQEVSGLIIWGQIADGTFYKSGTPNYNVLRFRKREFKDPISENNYPLGVTSFVGGRYETAFILEGDSWYRARVSWNWNPRSTQLIDGKGFLGGNVFTLSNPVNVWFLQVYDTVSWTGIIVWTTITKVSKDGQDITLDNNFTQNNIGISLSLAEWSGLIASKENNSIPVTDLSIDYPYLIGN